MEKVNTHILDFTSYIAEKTLSFTGREWVFDAIDTWLNKLIESPIIESSSFV
jgi:hypothetical protein